MKNITIHITLFISLFLSINGMAQSKLHASLYAEFKELPQSMSAPEIKTYAEGSKPLSNQHKAIITAINLAKTDFIPLGKRVKRKSVILIYIERKTDKDYTDYGYITINSKTFNKKTGDLIKSQHHLLDIGRGGTSTTYTGSFKQAEKNLLIFTQSTTEDGMPEKVTQQQYKFAKYLQFDKHLK